jgi:Domain of unknown function (DUF4041)/T5orf172 domain
MWRPPFICTRLLEPLESAVYPHIQFDRRQLFDGEAMPELLGLLLFFAIVGLGFLAYYAIQLRTENARLAAEHKHSNESAVALKGQYQGVVAKYNENVRKWNELQAGFNTEIQRLSKWQGVADADALAARLKQEAHAAVENARAESAGIVHGAQQQAAAILSETNQKAEAEKEAASSAASQMIAEAKQKAKSLTGELQAVLDSATVQAASIVKAANAKAEEIAGDVYRAAQNASVYEHAVKAMKNLIDGYGDQYIIPPQNLFDGLAEGFGHTQAGVELKRARECVKIMVKNGTAAACDYAEANRRETAVNFVVDAFNGKVDTILARTKHDNVGKLKQEILDAFALVNYNGKAFRDARITEQYLAARLDELRWASAVQHLVIQSREEQREAKERAREEARAKKEIERALRDAAKEETVLQKAIEQAKEQFEHASGEQKAMYEARLQEMSQRLQEAMERKDRARSMAEQTKRGHVYIISNLGSFGEDVFKIGLTRRWDPNDRIAELGGASVPFGFDVHAMILSEDAPALEYRLHEHFMLKQVNKVNHRKEFFRATLKEIRDEIEKLGVTGVSWTMTALAREYRETLATEKKIAESPAEREQWLRQQRHFEFEPDYDESDLVGVVADDD